MLSRPLAVAGHDAARSLARLRPDRRGVVAIITALLILPMVLAVGMSIDYARMAQSHTALQDAVDNAALAGATVYQAPGQSSAAVTVATNYFNAAQLPSMLTVAPPTVSAASGTNGSSYDVTVTASATIVPAFLRFVKSSFTMTATATASNPAVRVTVSAFSFNTGASDWNAVWLYPVPMNNGQPDYGTIPSQSSFYEVGSSCNASSNNYSSSSRCNGSMGATVSSTQTMPVIAATQPIGFAFQNMTAGLSGAGPNYYGSPTGHINWFYSALEAIGQPPSQNTKYTYTTYSNGRYTTVTTTYPTTSNSSTPNCSLLVQKLTTSTIPSDPPTSGCFSVTNTASGYPYTALSCAAMNGSTYIYWWNDMGGGRDSAYNDLRYAVTCSVGSGSGSGKTQVLLTQ
jgi:Flp pilus assembly protein TadG